MGTASELDAPGAHRGPRVLVCDDSALNRMIAQGLLERLGCRVTLAEDGVRGAELATMREFDLILMD